jgi:hypothetical protein
VKWILALIGLTLAAQPADQLRELSRSLKEASLDPEACFRVRDFVYRKNEVRLFLTDGVLMFRKPVNGVRTGAVFVASEAVDDAEILMIPPNRMERRSLASFTGSPNLDEHFEAAVFLFSDGTGEQWLDQLQKSETSQRSPERGVLLAERWNDVVRNLSDSFEPRLLEDLVNGVGPRRGAFFAAISGKKLGNFDFFFDPRNREEFLAGQLENVEGRSRYNFWAHFEPKRREPRAMPAPVAKIERFEVKAAIAADLRFKATVRISLRASEDNLRVLSLDLTPRLNIKAARWNGVPIEVFQRDALRANLLRNGDSEAVLFGLGTTLKLGEAGVLEVEEEGSLFFRAGNGVLYLANRASWFPQLNFQAAPFEARFEHPKELTLVCPGTRSEAISGELKQTTCKVDRPIRLFGFNLGSFESSAVKRGGFDVEVYANKTLESALERRPPPMYVPPLTIPGQRRRVDVPLVVSSPPIPADPLSRMPSMAEDLAGALEYFNGLFGPPPLSRVVAAPIPGSFGQGFPGFLYLSTLAYLEDRYLPTSERAEWEGRNFREILQAHELAHQWWGNQVAFDNYRDEWLSEALANYSALLYLEKRRGMKAVDTVLEEYKRRLLIANKEGKTADATGPVVFGMRLRHADPVAWHAITYGKSTWVLHLLRNRIGDAAFLKLLGQLAREYSGKQLTTEDLRRMAAVYLAKDAPDRELVNFFETWVYGTGIPQLDLTTTVKGPPGRKVVELRLKQTQVPEDFELDIPVEILMPGGKKITRWLRTGSEEEVLEVATGAAPVKVLLDPRATVLRR